MTDQPVTIHLGNVPDRRLATLTRDLGRDLSRAGIAATPVEAPTTTGDRGEAVTLGALALALVSSGAVTAMIECFKAYLTRERSLSISIANKDGTTIQVTSKNIDTSAVQEALAAAVSAKPR